MPHAHRGFTRARTRTDPHTVLQRWVRVCCPGTTLRHTRRTTRTFAYTRLPLPRTRIQFRLPVTTVVTFTLPPLFTVPFSRCVTLRLRGWLRLLYAYVPHTAHHTFTVLLPGFVYLIPHTVVAIPSRTCICDSRYLFPIFLPHAFRRCYLRLITVAFPPLRPTRPFGWVQLWTRYGYHHGYSPPVAPFMPLRVAGYLPTHHV